MTRIAIAGAAGRMGRHLIEAAHNAEGTQPTVALEAPGHPSLGTDAGVLAGVGELGLSIGGDSAAQAWSVLCRALLLSESRSGYTLWSSQ